MNERAFAAHAAKAIATSTETCLETARQNVLAWIRTASGDQNYPTGGTGAVVQPLNDTVIQNFLRFTAAAGFGYEIVEVNKAGESGYEMRWTHRGASFVGFKQPRAEPSPEAALLAGCGALLQNQWCRDRLDAGDSMASQQRQEGL